jgi:hypothetical protein
MSPTISFKLLSSTPQSAARLLNDYRAVTFGFLALLGMLKQDCIALNILHNSLHLKGTVAYLVLYRLILYPYFLSPLRHIPGPPLGHPVYGQFPAIIKGEAGIPQREWVKKHGSVVRAVGPIGIERLIFMNPDALHKILVSDWVDYVLHFFFL